METSYREIDIRTALVDIPAASMPNTHSPRSVSRYATTVRGLDWLGRGDVLANTDSDRFVNNI